MEFHMGRLFDHVHLRVRDLDASLRFYRAVLEVVGVPIARESPGHFFQADEFFVSPVDPGTPPSERGVHLAFQAKDRETVQRFHKAALAAGGRDNGGPGERPYHPGYYAAFVLDPDGNNIEVVFHGPSRRTAPSVVVTPAG
ncbi:VOC family protein [Pyxidicoccus fallax]|uniref:VOC family protein n=1 Tax=Pyxidicoccus fallax TaxID=394095 RepID=A0A848LN72_9BACT|nr:VOC family protein [Pyxidicoccus fallax]NMO19063.1 VOC family protein [Pyxidicoccus fallax]NPC82122.1 VOC family protein [Pyxidicoccus fallax]